MRNCQDTSEGYRLVHGVPVGIHMHLIVRQGWQMKGGLAHPHREIKWQPGLPTHHPTLLQDYVHVLLWTSRGSALFELGFCHAKTM